MSTVRLRRLQADYQKLQDFVNRHPRVQLIQADGDPPERYQLQFQVRSLRQKDDQLVVAKTRLVEITLPRNYPRTPPQCRMLTPIFHPNIAPHAICIGDHWSAGESLSSIVARIGEMIAYQSYNTKSPLNGEAARWTDENLDQLPLDAVSMLPEEDEEPGPAPRQARARPAEAEPPQPRGRSPELDEPPPRPRSAGTSVAIEFLCPECSARLRVPANHGGKRARCPKCQAVVAVPPGGVD